ncbi:alpha-N-acetylgalactosamine-specific lectin-like [Ptychodera flava]|uniref:alpha-N-acetylgalactosamine-specific lectin-like n=1 Tax=Ptychodera flava TaxID=63121 RepID=UPI00396A7503
MLKTVILVSCMLFSAALAGPCPSGWIKFKKSCYHGIASPMYTYQEAKQVCEGLRSTLAVVNDAEENLFLKRYTLNQFHFWIGLDDIDSEGNYVWADGSSLTYSNWNSAQPDNYGNNEDCVHLISNADGKWNDLPCSNRISFICERKARN